MKDLSPIYHQLKPRRFDATSFDVECPACSRGIVRLYHAQNTWHFERCCSAQCGHDINRSWHEFYLGERPPRDASYELALAHATKLLAAFVRLAEMMPAQFDDAMAPILHEGMTAAGGLVTQLDELARRLAPTNTDTP